MYRFFLSLLLMCSLVLPISARAGQDSGRDGTTPTGWYFYHGQTLAQVISLVNSGQRLTSFKQETFGATPTYSISTVTNSGVYNETWWYYAGVDVATVSSHLSANNARLISVDPYDNGSGALRLNVIMVSNTGANAKSWWWYVNTNTTALGTAFTTNNARPVDLKSYTLGATTYYACIMISNTGTDNLPWGWFANASISSVSAFINSNNQRIIAISVNNPDTPTFDVCLEQNNQSKRWYWYVGTNDTQSSEAATQLRCRQSQFETYRTSTGAARNLNLLIDNSEGITERVGNILSDAFGAYDVHYGLYLKQVNGPVLADLQSGLVFEPASTIKTLVHAHTMKQVQNGLINMSSPTTMYQTLNGSCPVDTNPVTQTLLTTESLMMQNSDNRATQCMVNLWGRPAINATGAALGMTNTLIQHRIGCASDAIANPNHLTLHDVGSVHEQISNGWLNPTNRDLFRSIMQNSVTGYPGFGPITLGTIITQEAAAAGLSASDRAAFTNACRVSWKAGNYVFITTSQIDHVTLGGWASLPFRDMGVVAPKEYVFGTFVNNSSTGTTPSGNTIGQASAEILREQVRAAMYTWACRADFNADNVVDFFDYLDFVNAFANNRPGGDYNGDGVIDLFDYLDFLNAYTNGC